MTKLGQWLRHTSWMDNNGFPVYYHKPWKKYIQTRLRTFGGVPMVLRCNIDLKSQDNLWNISSFYKDMLCSWQNIITCNGDSQENELLWNNKDITIGGKPVFYRLL